MPIEEYALAAAPGILMGYPELIGGPDDTDAAVKIGGAETRGT